MDGDSSNKKKPFFKGDPIRIVLWLGMCVAVYLTFHFGDDVDFEGDLRQISAFLLLFIGLRVVKESRFNTLQTLIVGSGYAMVALLTIIWALTPVDQEYGVRSKEVEGVENWAAFFWLLFVVACLRFWPSENKPTPENSFWEDLKQKLQARIQGNVPEREWQILLDMPSNGDAKIIEVQYILMGIGKRYPESQSAAPPSSHEVEALQQVLDLISMPHWKLSELQALRNV